MQDTVLVHLASKALPGIDVLFLETGYHFIETIGTADAVEAVYDVTLRRLLPLQTVAEQDAQYGKDLFARDPDLCCALRKVAPLNKALKGYEAWATGVRRAESPTRANTPVVHSTPSAERSRSPRWPPGPTTTSTPTSRRTTCWSIRCSAPDYPSIGCEPCTRRVLPGQDSRAGRWAGLAKTECGINI